MRLILPLLVFIFGSSCAFAYELHTTVSAENFEPISIELSSAQDVFLGELNKAPVLYEVTILETRTLPLQLFQLKVGENEPLQLALLVVRQNGGNAGVSEVARFRPPATAWVTKKDSATALTFLETEQFEVELKPGNYLIEVSTPENIGKYMLHTGVDDGSSSYFSTLSNTRATQEFFGYSSIHMLRSPYVYYPIILLILLVTFWRLRKLLKSTLKNEEVTSQ